MQDFKEMKIDEILKLYLNFNCLGLLLNRKNKRDWNPQYVKGAVTQE